MGSFHNGHMNLLNISTYIGLKVLTDVKYHLSIERKIYYRGLINGSIRNPEDVSEYLDRHLKEARRKVGNITTKIILLVRII